MRYKRGYHEAKTINSKRQSLLNVSFVLLIMAPRTHYAKSQEVVYKRLGSSTRPKFKAVHAKLRLAKKSSSVDDTASSEQHPPAVVVPPDDRSQFGPDEGSSFMDYEIPQRKRKVRPVLHIYSEGYGL